ncbi:hypothetical protein [Herbiconiux sp. UC225_62]|uniref:hypothetical protein n=1 Tax=Herbiconiux sp. UC225_62 TaxID=3350168 RepID=UPI0036D222A3
MEPLLLSAHVLAGILFVGPATVASSLFTRYVPVADPIPDNARDDGRSSRVALALHRITRVYGLLGVAVPVFGVALALVQQRFGEIWITIAMVLTAVAGALLAFRIVPAQAAAIVHPPARRRLLGLAALAGVFSLLWAVVVVLMIVRPGSDYSS